MGTHDEYWNNPVASGNTAKSSKPRICEVLGVEVGEKFTLSYPHRTYQELSVHDDGRVWGRNPESNKEHKIGSAALCWLINHPESICHLPRLSPAEMELLQSLYKSGAKWACRDRNSAWVYFYRRKPTYVENSGAYYGNADETELASIYASAFPSIHYEDLLNLEEVCNATE